ncbi:MULTISPECIES: hypothetical protein [Bradyrhizobium]|uniref:hypothetical protein n=1 Tax=Bradyrhizobium TaxID=374 RepID=UPI001141D104|nr:MULTISPECIES: hypothetical protein [Bradyrhizobium]QOG20624.1 hypothetical protein FOM02_28010 [Bradyrhizobium sp. SEMIA]UFW46037.1 hypothetical protein BaraCB756_27405 [Bradyrhizobium arachidis]
MTINSRYVIRSRSTLPAQCGNRKPQQLHRTKLRTPAQRDSQQGKANATLFCFQRHRENFTTAHASAVKTQGVLHIDK